MYSLLKDNNLFNLMEGLICAPESHEFRQNLMATLMVTSNSIYSPTMMHLRHLENMRTPNPNAPNTTTIGSIQQ